MLLQTARLHLEPLRVGHAEALFDLLQDPALYRFIPLDPPASRAALAERYTRLERRASPDGSAIWLNWAARLGPDGDFVGTIEATVNADRTADIAYFIFPRHQRRGYAREACERVIQHLVTGYRVGVVAATIDTRNAASIALVESLGFKRSGFIAEADFFKGSISDELRYERRQPPSRR